MKGLTSNSMAEKGWINAGPDIRTINGESFKVEPRTIECDVCKGRTHYYLRESVGNDNLRVCSMLCLSIAEAVGGKPYFPDIGSGDYSAEAKKTAADYAKSLMSHRMDNDDKPAFMFAATTSTRMRSVENFVADAPNSKVTCESEAKQEVKHDVRRADDDGASDDGRNKTHVHADSKTLPKVPVSKALAHHKRAEPGTGDYDEMPF